MSGLNHTWHWRGEELIFLPSVFWRPEGRELMVADMHLGKAELFQAHGIALPSDGDRGTLNHCSASATGSGQRA